MNPLEKINNCKSGYLTGDPNLNLKQIRNVLFYRNTDIITFRRKKINF